MQLDAQTQAATIAATADALRALPSDEQRREALAHAPDAGTATSTELALQVSPGLASDHDHHELLEHVARHLAGTADDGTTHALRAVSPTEFAS